MVVIKDDLFREESRRPELISLSIDFIEESGWGVTPDPNAMWDYIESIATHPWYVSYCAVDTDTGMLVGYSTGSYGRAFTKEYTGVIEYIYVKPEYRNYKTAYRLLKATHDGLVDRECVHIFTNSVSDISARVSGGFSGIIQRIGYAEEGSVYGWSASM